MPRRVFWLLMLLLVFLVIPGHAAANSAPPRYAGDTGGLVLPGASEQVHIKGEVLRFDLQDGLQQAQVTARYQMVNRGPALSRFAVVFALQDTAVDSAKAVQVTWNGRPVAVEAVQTESLTPAGRATVEQAWTAESTLIDPTDGERYQQPDNAYDYGRGSLKLVRFYLDMASGTTGDLEVSYRHDAAEDRTRRVNRVYTYQYLLLPARSWASFGPLEVQVKLPEAAYFRSTLPLALENGEYRGRFESLPQENLVFGVMSSRGVLLGWVDAGPYYGMAFLLFLVMATLTGWALGWLAGRVRRRGWAIGLGVLLGAVVGGVADLALSFLSHAAFPVLANQGYGSPLAVIGQWFLGLLLTTVLAGVLAARYHRARYGAGAAGPEAAPPGAAG